jgi:hypothetical protein
MPASASRKRNRFGDAFRSRVTYHRDVAAERKELKRQAFADRRERLSIKKLEAQERAAAAKIAAADRKIAAAESKISAAASKGGRGGHMSEAQFEATRERLQKEIEKQEKDKSLARALFDEVRAYGKGKNPSWGYGIYQGTGFTTRQLAHFRSKAAAEVYARSAGLKGYSIKRAFDKGQSNPTSTGRTAAGNPCGQHDRGLSRNSALEFSTEYHLGYNLGQADRQSARLRKTLDELHATFNANFAPGAMASWESFEQAYQAGYGGQMGAAAPNPVFPQQYIDSAKKSAKKHHRTVIVAGTGTGRVVMFFEGTKRIAYGQGYVTVSPDGSVSNLIMGGGARSPEEWRRLREEDNPEPAGDGSEEYEQARKIAELFHGRPVKEEITVTESIREHDWLWRIGPLVKLKIRTLTKRNATLPFHQTEEGMVHLFCSPDGRQFYLRGGDQELDLKALGMGESTEWYRDHMLIGEAKEITYRDKKRFHSFKIVDYFHRLGEVTKKKPMLAYDALAGKMSIIGGQYKVETDELTEGMSPGIVN